MDRYGLICRSIYEDSDVTQRELSSILGISLGSVNKLVGECLKDGLIQNHSEYGSHYHRCHDYRKKINPFKHHIAMKPLLQQNGQQKPYDRLHEHGNREKYQSIFQSDPKRGVC